MKHQVIITKKVFRTIRQCVLEADNNYETGGVLIGYHLWRMHIVVAITTPSTNSISSRVSFLLDGAEHTQKVNDIISGFWYSPSVLGIWHSHICDGHKFSKQDMISNRTLAKSLGGVLSMLVTKSTHTIVFSISHISTTGTEEDCAVTVRAKAEMEEKRMNGDERCSNCIYWQNRKCVMTGQTKNDGICTCGQFKKCGER